MNKTLSKSEEGRKVRCINCLCWDPANNPHKAEGFGRCGRLLIMTNKDWWCPHGAEMESKRDDIKRDIKSDE